MAKRPQPLWTAWLQRARHFLEEQPHDGTTGSPIVRRLRHTAQFIYLVTRGFADNRGPLRAAALTYTTLLALVPLLAVMFSLSRSFLAQSSAEVVPRLIDQMVEKVAPQLSILPANGQTNDVAAGHVVVSSEARRQTVEIIQSFLSNINAGTLGTLGTLALIMVAIQLLMTIEQTFNDIWGVEKGRSLLRKIIYYWAWLTLGPLVIVGAMTLTGTAEFAHVFNRFGFLSRLFLQLAPFLVLWLGFAGMYGLMPNTRVRFHAALIGGIVAGTLWQLNSLLNAMYMSRVVSYSKLYGSLGIIPVFLIGLYFSWLIVLFGAQVSFAAQNSRSYFQERASRKLDQHSRDLLACRLLLAVCQNFLTGKDPLTLTELADRLNAPSQACNRIAHRLVEGELLSELTDTGALQPARPPETITIADVLHLLRTQALPAVADAAPKHPTDPVETLLLQLHADARASTANRNFCDLSDSALKS